MRRKKSIWKGVIAGVAGGLAGSWTMGQFETAISKLGSNGRKPQKSDIEEDATIKTARAVMGVFHKQLPKDKKKIAGPLVHYLYGAGIGALYGGMAQRKPMTASGFGSTYGTLVWAMGDEVAVPALKLGKKSTEVPISSHAKYLAAHLVYSATLEGVRRLALRVI